MSKKPLESPALVAADEATHAAELAFAKLERAKMAVEVAMSHSIKLHELAADAQLAFDAAEKTRVIAVAAAQVELRERFGVTDDVPDVPVKPVSVKPVPSVVPVATVPDAPVAP